MVIRKAELTATGGCLLGLTAVTRARKLCVVVGNRKAIAMAVRNAKVEKRCSGLRGRVAALGGGGT